MTHGVIIDGVDIRQQYNVLLEHGAYLTLVQWPEMKTVRGNNWQESDGFEPDLSNPLLESRTVNLRFILKGSSLEIDGFYRFLGSKPKHVFNFTGIGRTVTLRLTSMPSAQYALKFHLLQVQFEADIPLEGYSYVAPSSSIPEKRDYVIDGRPLTDYGITVLQGTISSVIKASDVKPLLVQKSSVINGAKYDENPILNDPNNEFDSNTYETIGGSIEGVAANWKRSLSHGTVTYMGRDITLKCLLKTSTPAEAWRNYDALLHDLTKTVVTSDTTLAGAREIIIRPISKTFLCYYKSQNVENFLCRDGLTWIQFDFTLTLFQDKGDVSYFLATEDGGFVITEDGKIIPISPVL